MTEAANNDLWVQGVGRDGDKALTIYFNRKPSDDEVRKFHEDARNLMENKQRGGPWRCFHCGEVFTTPGGAQDHFGTTLAQEPGCLIDFKVQVEEGGKPDRGRGLLMALRRAEAQLQRYREEDTDLHREIHGLQSKHQVDLRREEEKGYARGLRDGVNLPAESPERAGLTDSPLAMLIAGLSKHIEKFRYTERNEYTAVGNEDGEQYGFMIEAALQVGFEMIDDNGDVFVCNARQVVDLMTRAYKANYERGLRDGRGQ